MPDRTRSLPRLGAAGVSLAPPNRSACACTDAWAPRCHDQGITVEELTGSRRADAAAGVSSSAEHAVLGTTHATADSLSARQSRDETDRESESGTDGEGALAWAGGSVVGACAMIALFLAMALLGGCVTPHCSTGAGAGVADRGAVDGMSVTSPDASRQHFDLPAVGMTPSWVHAGRETRQPRRLVVAGAFSSRATPSSPDVPAPVATDPRLVHRHRGCAPSRRDSHSGCTAGETPLQSRPRAGETRGRLSHTRSGSTRPGVPAPMSVRTCVDLLRSIHDQPTASP